jgi:nucleoside-diphosphate-sugar epimerase
MIFVTGAGGYIGGAIARNLAGSGLAVTGGIRRYTALPSGVSPVITGDLATAQLRLERFDSVIHAAGLGHRRGVPESVWRSANVDAAINVARQARAAGVKKFILISSAHIHGRVHDGVVTDTAPPNPMDHYAASKLQAEETVATAFGPGLTIIRPTAVIGPRCPGNLQLLMKLLQHGIPLPFASIANQRSFIDVEDLACLALLVLQSVAPPPFILAAYPDSIATPELIRALANGMAVRPRLLPCPPGLLAAGASLLGRAAMWQSLAGDFIASPQAALALGWTPAKTLVESLIETGAAFVVS